MIQNCPCSYVFHGLGLFIVTDGVKDQHSTFLSFHGSFSKGLSMIAVAKAV